MTKPTEQILASIDAYQPVDGNWRSLDDLLAELWSAGVPSAAIPVLLRLFERFPGEEDGAGVFWSIVHGVEALPGYEPPLLASVRRVPSDFGVLMVGRILNGGQQEIAGFPVRAVLAELMQRAGTTPESKQYIQAILDRNA